MAKQDPQLDRLPRAEDAAFNSFKDQHKPQCLEGTQVNILQKVQAWVGDPGEKCIFWLNGMAGTGKSTIARTVAAAFHDKRHLINKEPLANQTYLGASFFFTKGDSDRNNAKKFFTTLARRLAEVLPDLKGFICNSIDKYGDIGGQALSNQWRYLIFEPLLILGKNLLSPLILILVIDALDECEGDSDIRMILQLFSQVQDLNAIQLRVFITSRPETSLRLGFGGMVEILHYQVLNKIPRSDTKDSTNLWSTNARCFC